MIILFYTLFILASVLRDSIATLCVVFSCHIAVRFFRVNDDPRICASVASSIGSCVLIDKLNEALLKLLGVALMSLLPFAEAFDRISCEQPSICFDGDER